MNKNVKVVYQASLGKIVMLVYDGNELTFEKDYDSWEFELLPDYVQVHFELDVPKYD